MGPIDQAQFGTQLKTKHHGVHQASWPRDNRCAAAGPPQDRHLLLPACSDIDFIGHVRRTADNDHRSRRFPQP